MKGNDVKSYRLSIFASFFKLIGVYSQSRKTVYVM